MSLGTAEGSGKGGFRPQHPVSAAGSRSRTQPGSQHLNLSLETAAGKRARMLLPAGLHRTTNGREAGARLSPQSFPLSSGVVELEVLCQPVPRDKVQP